jgi:hypothetical protein
VQPARANDRNFCAFLHNSGAHFCINREGVANRPKNLPINHNVAKYLSCTIPDWNALYASNSLAKSGATAIMRVIPYEGNP